MPQRIRPIKRLGQNFLTDPNIARKIVDAVPAPSDGHVVEIGPGTGALTALLSSRYANFVALEIDPRAVEVLQESLPGVDVREGDVLDVNWRSLAKTQEGAHALHVVGNLPYYLTSQILFSLIEAGGAIATAVVMMQREVADRIVAPPGSRTYGILSVVLQHYADVELLFRVSRNVFYPRPDVTSAVVRFTFRDETAGTDPAFDTRFREVVRAAFNQRRKTLRNSLATILEARGVVLPEIWAGRRAEELSPAEFVSLTRFIDGA